MPDQAVEGKLMRLILCDEKNNEFLINQLPHKEADITALFSRIAKCLSERHEIMHWFCSATTDSSFIQFKARYPEVTHNRALAHAQLEVGMTYPAI